MLFLKICLALVLIVAPGVARAADESEGSTLSSYTYEEPTMANFSRLYWGLDRLSLENDVHVDNYVLINECEIYRDYYHNEFEWKTIREAAREQISKAKHNFPLRFSFVQPLNLAEYDFKKGGFHVLDEHVIRGARRFEMMATDSDGVICGKSRDIEAYPRGLLLQLSRPLILDFVPTSPDQAEKFIDRTGRVFKTYEVNQQTEENLYESRRAYLVLKVKVFSYQEDVRKGTPYTLAGFLAVLEELDVYGDANLKELLYKKSFRRRRKASKLEEELKRKYEERKRAEQERKGE